MAHQLIYTSAARLLDAGRSGFGTVARSKTISPLLVSAIERVSQFSNIRGTDRSRVIFVHRRMVAGSNRFHIISRIADAGADYTGRTNHIAHHLIVTQEEMARAAAAGITPADVLKQFPWLSRWEGNARFLTPEEDVNLAAFHPLARQSARSGWAGMTGNPAHSRLLAWDGAPRNGILLMPVHADPLALLAEALAECGTQSWSKAFTTSLETTDELSELDWIIATPATFPEIQKRCGNRTILDLTQPQSLPVPTEPIPEPHKIPAPNLTPRAEPIPASITPKPVIRPVQTGAGQVRVGGSATGKSRPSLAKPAARPKQTVPIIVASAVAVMALVILGMAVLKFGAPNAKGDESTADIPSLNSNQKAALDNLKTLAITEEMAKGKELLWNAFFERVSYYVRAATLDGSIALPSLIETDRSGLPEWGSKLAAEMEKLDGLLKTPKDSKSASEADAIKAILEALKVYTEKSVNSNEPIRLTEADLKTFESKLNERFADVIDGKVENQNPEADKLANNKGDKPDETQKALPPKSLENTRGGATQSEKDAHSAKETAVPEPDLTGVKQKQIIIVSENDLKNGVEVELLKRLLSSISATELCKKGFKIVIGEQEIESLVKAQKGSYSDKFINSQFEIYEDGRVTLSPQMGEKIEFSFEAANKKFITYVVADEKKTVNGGFDKEPFIDGIKFKFVKNGEDAVNLEGDLQDWLLALDKTVNIEIDLVGVSSHPYLIDSDGKKYSFVRKKPPENIIFSANARDQIVKSLEKWGGIYNAKKLSAEEKNENEKNLDDAFIELKNNIQTAIGGAIILKELNKNNDSEINIKDSDLINKFYLNKYAGKKDRIHKLGGKEKDDNEKNKKFRNDLEVIKKDVGENKFSESLKKIAGEDWDTELKGDPGKQKIENYIHKILKETEKLKSIPSYFDELKDVKQIIIKTSNYRVLFKATRQP